MEQCKYLIVGGGMVAGYAVKEMVKQGLQAGEACLVSAESVPPYQRPPLSKDYFTGEREAAKIFINKGPFYDDNSILLKLNTRIASLDLTPRRARTGDGEELGFEKLLLATGSAVRHLELPGSDCEDVLYLRSLASCDRIKERAANARRAVVVGGGFIGSEVAARLGALGPEVTLVHREPKLLSFFLTPELSTLYEDRYRQHEVRVIAETEVTGFIANHGLKAVQLANGDRLEADMAVVGVGVYPETELAAAAGLQIDRGVIVNEFLETKTPGVYVAGDAAQWYDQRTRKHRHVEHEDHARNSGKHVARVMMGDRQAFDYLPMFWSEAYDLSWEFWGETRGADQVIYRGDLSAADFSAWWLREGAVVGAMVTEHRHDTEAEPAQAWIKAAATVPAERLRDDTVALEGPG